MAELLVRRLHHPSAAVVPRSHPVIVDVVTTMTGPGEMIDVVVTERGIAINPGARTCSTP